MGRPKNNAERFWKRVDKNGTTPAHKPDIGPCWLWTGAKDNKGYGVTTFEWKYMTAHRAAYMFHHGNLEGAEFVCHHCDNPPCVNPEHLFLGTNRDNTADKVSKQRQSRGEKHSKAILPGRKRGEAHYSHKLTEQNVLEIRKLWAESKIPLEQLAVRFGVSYGTLERAARGTSWKHLPKAIPQEGARHAKLTKESVLEMRSLRESGLTVIEIAHRFGISRFTCNDVVYRRSWKSV